MAGATDESVISSSSWDSCSSPAPFPALHHHHRNKQPHNPLEMTSYFDEEEIYGYVEIGKSLQVTSRSSPPPLLYTSLQDLKSTILNYYQKDKAKTSPPSFHLHLSATNLQKLTSRVDCIEQTVKLYSTNRSDQTKGDGRAEERELNSFSKTPIDESPDPTRRPLYPPKISPLDLSEKVSFPFFLLLFSTHTADPLRPDRSETSLVDASRAC
jgi:hypothetical protein